MNASRAPYTFPSSGPKRLAKTFADYLAIGVGPILIMFMVGSLNFFLVEIGYRGSFAGQVHWTLFWFTVASVLVSRISIEQGSTYGSLYGLALGAATGLRLCQFLGAPLSVLLLLAFIWWCAAKLTWDCTLIDDQTDASGEGLLQRTGLEPIPTSDALTSQRRQGWFTRFRLGGRSSRIAPTTGAASASDTSDPPPRPHAPGAWVIYFSLAALPVFGLGQWLIPVADAAARLRGFLLAALFVASTLALLLSTSFLGLRRYLRQRQLVMPPAIARSWMILGGTMILAVLLGALLLPRPRGFETLAHLGLGVRERSPTASEHAWMQGEAADGSGRRIGRSRTDQKSPDDGPRSRSAASDSQASTKSEQGREADRPDASEPAGEPEHGQSASPDGAESRNSGQRRGGTPARSSSPTSPTPPPPIPAQVPEMLRWLSYLLAFVVVAFVILRFGRSWLDALRAARVRRKAPGPGSIPTTPHRKSFSEFDNPFVSGRAEGMSPVDLTSYTFAALEAWAADAGQPRRPDQTPFEFGQNLARTAPSLHDPVLNAVRIYASAAYGHHPPGPDTREMLRRLWMVLRPS